MEFVTAIQNRDAKELVQILIQQEKQESDEAFSRLIHSSIMSSVSLLHWAAELGSKVVHLVLHHQCRSNNKISSCTLITD